MNNNNNIKKIESSSNNNLGVIIGFSILLLFLIFIIYNKYPNNNNHNIKKDYTKEYEILLDSKNNNGNPYHFKQNFGSDKKGELKYNKNYEITTLDKGFDFFENEDCNKIFNQITLNIKMKFPYIYPNKGWENSYKNIKPILNIGNSPTINYNPYHNYIEIGIQYKGKSVFTKTKYIKLENILLQKWLDYYFVIDNRKVKIYLDKKLIKYVLLDSVPILNINKYTNIKFGEYHNNFNGLVEKIIFYRNALSSTEIKNL